MNVDEEKLKITKAIDLPPQDKKTCKNIEKVRIFSKGMKKNSKHEKKDKKNIVKNIVKIFVTWLEKKRSDKGQGNWVEALAELKQLLQKENFNNRLIKNIVDSHQCNKAFL